ncbi:MAG: 3-hydroxybutyryl-CoA dehydrogenase [Bacteroidetes bacterium]|nr:MAG: 3-hydroxybutyryl-CoA dehydrogenase [Bacteroidota bacterium]
MAFSIGIVGAGTRGAGIAHTAALHKCTVSLYDINEEVIRRSVERINFEMKKSVDKSSISEDDMKEAMSRIRKRTNINDLDTCDVIIDAVLEEVRVKKDLFKKLDQIAHHTTILATTTSHFSVASIAAATKKPERVVGMHFFYPVHLSKAVEVVRGVRTSDETVAKAAEAVKKIGGKPVFTKDTPGQVVNRIQHHLYAEALAVAAEGTATYADIDRIVKLSGGFKQGPFEALDLNGVEEHHLLTEALYARTYGDPRFRPSALLQQMTDAGTTGKKTKRGFYNYEVL